MVVTGTLTVSSLFVLRRTQPERARPYRASGYPWLPGLYVAADDQHELRRYTYKDGKFSREVLGPLDQNVITWNITAGTM